MDDPRLTPARPDLAALYLKGKIEAARYVAMENLALSPQCGFASVETGNPVTPQVQEAKLRLAVELARDIWGES